jgi:hypothetical protein
MQFIAGTNRNRPAQSVEAEADRAGRRPALVEVDQAHGQRRGVPAAGDKLAEDRPAAGFLVEMKGLRVKLFGESNDVVLCDAYPSRGLDDLSDNEIFEKSFTH